jgi:cobalt/nickel transport system permease protein
MHMADALLSPVIGGAFWVASGALLGYSAKRIAQEQDHSKTPMMGVFGAFIFAAQMINFTIPGTGSSGHIGGGILLAVLLGPYRAFVTLASVLVLQALLFADGGIMALGCNIFNLAFFPAFIAYPLVFRPIIGKNVSKVKLFIASMIAAETGLFLGAFSVVIQTSLSGISELPFKSFLLFMMPVHLLIAIGEGLVTWAVLSFVTKAEPDKFDYAKKIPFPKMVVGVFIVLSIGIGGFVSWFASSNPDGLEWSVEKVAGTTELKPVSVLHEKFEQIQRTIAFLPDYSFNLADQDKTESAAGQRLGTSVSGIAGSAGVLLVAIIIGMLLRLKSVRSQTRS